MQRLNETVEETFALKKNNSKDAKKAKVKYKRNMLNVKENCEKRVNKFMNSRWKIKI